jgi:hypothetical protein
LTGAAAAARNQERRSVTAAIQADGDLLLGIAATPVDAGRIVQSGAETEESGTWLVPLLSGAMLGLMLGVAVAVTRHLRGGRIAELATARAVVVRLPASPATHPAAVADAVAVLSAARVQHLLSATPASVDDTRALLERAMSGPDSPARTVRGADGVGIIVPSRARQRDVDMLARRLGRVGAPLAAVVLVPAGSTADAPAPPTPPPTPASAASAPPTLPRLH